MRVKIKKLSPALIDDYLDFFDNKAFTDHKEWSKCYCMFFHMTDEMEAKIDESGEINTRELAIDYIKKGRLNGYLAYAGGEVVGWVNTDDKSTYYALSRIKNPKLWADYDGERIKSVVCFIVAPDFRGKGIATKLLERVAKDARRKGYEYLEAYPIKGAEDDCFTNYHGPMGLYNKVGFYVFKEMDANSIVRMRLTKSDGRVALVCPYKVED